MDLIALLLLLIIIGALFGGVFYSPLLFILIALVLIVWLVGYGRPWAGRRY